MRRHAIGIASRAAAWGAAFLFLAVVTQIGAVVLLSAIPAWRYAEGLLRPETLIRRVALRSGLFLALYAAVSAFVVPPLAAMADRVPLPCSLSDRTALLGPTIILTCVLNRHYATVGVDDILMRAARSLSTKTPGVRIGYLDAGFPFFDAFPMLPHLSHRNGRAVDLSYFYIDPAPSPLGYWGYIQPRPGEPAPCAGARSWLRWDLDWLQPVLGDGRLDEAGTAALIETLAGSTDVTRMFLEPHLKARLGLDHRKIRFQGCRAARHDDHLHVEFRITPGASARSESPE